MVTALRKHKSIACHKTKELHGPKPKAIDSIFVSREKEQLVQNAEISRMAAFFAEHNLSFHVMDHFSNLVQKLFPDSPTVLHFRTKTKCIIQNACALYFHNVLTEQLRQSFFSLIIDETTDVSTTKELALVCKLYYREKKAVVTHFYNMIPVVSGSAESLYESIFPIFNEDKIPSLDLLQIPQTSCSVSTTLVGWNSQHLFDEMCLL